MDELRKVNPSQTSPPQESSPPNAPSSKVEELVKRYERLSPLNNQPPQIIVPSNAPTVQSLKLKDFNKTPPRPARSQNTFNSIIETVDKEQERVYVTSLCAPSISPTKGLSLNLQPGNNNNNNNNNASQPLSNRKRSTSATALSILSPRGDRLDAYKTEFRGVILTQLEDHGDLPSLTPLIAHHHIWKWLAKVSPSLLEPGQTLDSLESKKLKSLHTILEHVYQRPESAPHIILEAIQERLLAAIQTGKTFASKASVPDADSWSDQVITTLKELTNTVPNLSEFLKAFSRLSKDSSARMIALAAIGGKEILTQLKLLDGKPGSKTLSGDPVSLEELCGRRYPWSRHNLDFLDDMDRIQTVRGIATHEAMVLDNLEIEAIDGTKISMSKDYGKGDTFVGVEVVLRDIVEALFQAGYLSDTPIIVDTVVNQLLKSEVNDFSRIIAAMSNGGFGPASLIHRDCINFLELGLKSIRQPYRAINVKILGPRKFQIIFDRSEMIQFRAKDTTEFNMGLQKLQWKLLVNEEAKQIYGELKLDISFEDWVPAPERQRVLQHYKQNSDRFLRGESRLL